MPGQFSDIEESLSQLSILTVPFEVIEQILNYVPTSKDILNFALASKNCYAHAVPVLYRSVDWVLGMAFLLAHPDLLTVTRSLRVSEKKYAVGGDTKLCIDNPHDESPSRPTDMKNFELNAMHNNYPQMFHTTTTVLSVLPRFTGLTELILRSITLPRTFYQSVHALSDSNLRRLTLRYCRLTSRYPRGYDPATLRLTELTIFHIYARLPKLKALLKLSWSTTLRTLRLDRSTELALGSLAAHGLPSSVRAVELDFRGPAPAGRRMLEYLFPFLNSCKHVQHLELADMGKLDAIGQYPSHKRLAVNSLPSLTSIAVPTVYLDLLLFGRAIDSLTITDTTNRDPSHMAPIARFLTVDGIAEVLRILRGASISLQSFKFNLKTWDKELFYMLAAKQSQLKELHVTYQYGEPDDGHNFDSCS
ncbi:hypothetical protein DFH11DRAFT_1589181 [Phellopilus nigrolimitatus]|nr:hypothetical protein DFH11DRAFT_1589181 [Phellopilus nigrolimitatus]